MQDRTEMNREEPEQTYGFTVVPGSGQDSSALQEKLRAMPGVTGAEERLVSRSGTLNPDEAVAQAVWAADGT